MMNLLSLHLHCCGYTINGTGGDLIAWAEEAGLASKSLLEVLTLQLATATPRWKWSLLENTALLTQEI